ncbi:MAG: disulfide bond formation protein B [Candidatus Methylophosphatis roskildensis]
MKALFESPRIGFAAIFAICAGLIGYGLWLQQARGLEPCPMCIMQRYAFVVAGLLALIGALHGPSGWGRRIYALLILLSAVGGASVAVRQSWLQHNPPKVTECGADLDFMLDSFPLSDALPMIFRGAGDCSKVDWTFIGLSMAEWALIWFAIIGLFAALLWFVRATRLR